MDTLSEAAHSFSSVGVGVPPSAAVGVVSTSGVLVCRASQTGPFVWAHFFGSLRLLSATQTSLRASSTSRGETLATPIDARKTMTR